MVLNGFFDYNPFLRKSFDLVNIIKKKNPEENFIFFNSSNNFFDKLRVKLYYGNYELNKYTIKDDVIDFQYEFDFKTKNYIFFPIEENETKAFLKFDYNFREKINFLLPSYDKHNLISNKYKLNKYCSENNFPAPKFYEYIDANDYKKILPIVIKPRNSSGSRGILYINKSSDLNKIPPNLDDYVVQQKIGNSNKVDAVFCLCKSGKILSSYTHKRIRTYPMEGGVSVFSKKTFNQKLINMTSDLVHKLNLSGLLMFEFYLMKTIVSIS